METIQVCGRDISVKKVGECLCTYDSHGNMNFGRPSFRGKSLSRWLLGIADPKVYACHTCDNMWCVNVAHLYRGDAASNSQDFVDSGKSNDVHMDHVTKEELWRIVRFHPPVRRTKIKRI